MNAKKELITLGNYFIATRQVGHTTAMMEGAKNTSCLILTSNQMGVDRLKTFKPKGDVISIQNVEQDLRGRNQPLLLDNEAVVTVISHALEEIRRLEALRSHYKKALQKIADLGGGYLGSEDREYDGNVCAMTAREALIEVK